MRLCWAQNIAWQEMPTARETIVGDGGMNTKQSEWLALPAAVFKRCIVTQAKLPVVQSKRGLDNDWLFGTVAIFLFGGKHLMNFPNTFIFIHSAVQLYHMLALQVSMAWIPHISEIHIFSREDSVLCNVTFIFKVAVGSSKVEQLSYVWYWTGFVKFWGAVRSNKRFLQNFLLHFVWAPAACTVLYIQCYGHWEIQANCVGRHTDAQQTAGMDESVH